MRRIATTSAVALVLLGATGCATVSDFFSDVFSSSSSKGPSRVNDLVGDIETVYVDAEVAKTKATNAMTALETMVSPDFKGDAVGAYAQLEEVIKQSDVQAKKLRRSVAKMKKTAGPVFERWAADLEAFSSEAMRSRSRKRLDETRKRYETIVANVDAAQRSYDELNQGLHDHALFLGHDLNSASLAAIRGDVEALSGRNKQLAGRFDQCLVAAREYVDSAALPGSPTGDNDNQVRATAVSGDKATR